MKTVYFVTGNLGKLSEAKKKLSSINVHVVQKDLGYPEIQADNLEEVVTFGVDNIKKQNIHPFIIEDAGLFIDILNGFPGVYSSYVYHTIGLKGILNLLKERDYGERKACFKSVIGYCSGERNTRLFIGESQGVIAKQERGIHGFGYDPIFIPDDDDRTFAEMTAEVKNNYSHRGKSLQKFMDFFKNL
jgi:XTP/dITP diphosphohydrolase